MLAHSVMLESTAAAKPTYQETSMMECGGRCIAIQATATSRMTCRLELSEFQAHPSATNLSIQELSLGSSKLGGSK